MAVAEGLRQELAEEVLGGKVAREIREHEIIQILTGGIPARKSDAVANERDPIGLGRQHLVDGINKGKR